MTEITLKKAEVFKTKIGRIVLLVLLSKEYLVKGRPIGLVPLFSHSELGGSSIISPATSQATVKYDPALQSMLDFPKEAQLLAEKNESFDEKTYMKNEDKFDLPHVRLRKLLNCVPCGEGSGGGRQGGGPGFVMGSLIAILSVACIGMFCLRSYQWYTYFFGEQVDGGCQMVQGGNGGNWMMQGGAGAGGGSFPGSFGGGGGSFPGSCGGGGGSFPGSCGGGGGLFPGSFGGGGRFGGCSGGACKRRED